MIILEHANQIELINTGRYIYEVTSIGENLLSLCAAFDKLGIRGDKLRVVYH